MPTALLAAVVYPAVGIGFAILDSSSGPAQIHFWRLAAWVVSALVFGAHLLHEQRTRSAAPLQVAAHVSAGVALGAFLLAVWVLLQGHLSGARTQSPLAPLALILFPLLTGIPAFVAGVGVAGLARKLHRTR